MWYTSIVHGVPHMRHRCLNCGEPFEVNTYREITAKYCSVSCQRSYRKSPQVRFWPKILKSSGCWSWLGVVSDSGYGVLRSHPYTLAHRYSYELATGCSIPRGKMIRHLCGNKLCVNPMHLALGSHKDNAQDEVDRGSQIKGERSGNAKLDSYTVTLIRDLYSEGYGLTDLAIRFRLHKSHVHRLVNRVSWSHLL